MKLSYIGMIQRLSFKPIEAKFVYSLLKKRGIPVKPQEKSELNIVADYVIKKCEKLSLYKLVVDYEIDIYTAKRIEKILINRGLITSIPHFNEIPIENYYS